MNWRDSAGRSSRYAANPEAAAMAISGGPVTPSGFSSALTSPAASAPDAMPAPEAMLEEEMRWQYEEELRRDCEDLEAKLRKDPLRFQNEALEVQLVQMQDDYIVLQEDFRNMRDYFGNKLAEMTAQLEEQTRTAGTSKGHADCLSDLLPFHEDQGQHVDSYWRAQCEKRDDSIRFLTLKLQEYTVPSATYRAGRRKSSGDSVSSEGDRGHAASSSSRSPHRGPALDEPHPTGPAPDTEGCLSPTHAGISRSISQDVLTLESRHRELCNKYVLQLSGKSELQHQLEAIEANAAARSSELESQRTGGLFSNWMTGFGSTRNSGENSSGCAAGDGSALAAAAALRESAPKDVQRLFETRLAELEAERERLQDEVMACEGAVAVREGAREFDGEPLWAVRCGWRDQLDVRAGQLERISLQFDATKRQLDAANEELQWQATSAEALRMRLADVLRQTQVEEQKIAQLREEHRETQALVEELTEQWKAHAQAEGEGRAALPIVVQQAQWLLEALRRQMPPESKEGAPGPEGDVSEVQQI